MKPAQLTHFLGFRLKPTTSRTFNSLTHFPPSLLYRWTWASLDVGSWPWQVRLGLGLWSPQSQEQHGCLILGISKPESWRVGRPKSAYFKDPKFNLWEFSTSADCVSASSFTSPLIGGNSFQILGRSILRISAFFLVVTLQLFFYIFTGGKTFWEAIANHIRFIL